MFKYNNMIPVILSADKSGNFSTFRSTNQIPTTSKANGRTKVPQPANWEMDWIHQPVTLLRWEEISERMVRNPTKARKIPKISSLRSLEILLHCQPDFDEDRRGLRDLDLELDLEERVELRVDLVLVLEDFALDFELLETGFLAKRGLQNGKVVLIITNS